MMYLRILIGILTCFSTCYAKKTLKMPIYIGILQDSLEFSGVLNTVKADIERSDQFSIMIERCSLPKNKKDITRLGTDKPNYLLSFYIGMSTDASACEWRLYTTGDALMIGSGTVRREGTLGDWGHMIAHALWRELMGASGPFATRICYIKKEARSRHYRSVSSICIADWDGNDEETLLVTPHINIAPYWGLDVREPYVYVSEFTQRNVRLKMVDFMQRQRVILDFDGTIVGVSCAVLGGDVAYGRSGEIWRYSYDAQRKKGRHILEVREEDVCSSPTIVANGDILYGSGGKIKWRRADKGTREIVIGDGYCVAPAYHAPSGKIVYSRRVRGVMQLCLYDTACNRDEQLTFDGGDKIDACWSPCGSWVCYCVETKSKGRIAKMHIKTKKRSYITRIEDNCRFPAWSPLYEHLPHVTTSQQRVDKKSFL